MEQWLQSFVWIALWRILTGLAVCFVWHLRFGVGQGLVRLSGLGCCLLWFQVATLFRINLWMRLCSLLFFDSGFDLWD